MAFKFRLEKVLTIRREAVDEARANVLAAQKALQEVKEMIIKTSIEITQRNEDLIKNNYQMAQEHMRVIKKLNKKLEELKKELVRREKNLENTKIELIEAQKKLEALEKLKEKQAEEFYTEQNRLEQIQTDEKAALKYATDLMLKQQENSEEFLT
jgi:flagellar export protein FliJ